MAERKRRATGKTGLTQDAIKQSIENAFDRYVALPTDKQNIRNSGRFKWDCEILVTKDSVALVKLPLKLLLAGGFSKGNAGTIAAVMPANTLEQFIPPVKIATNAQNTVNRPEILRREGKVIGNYMRVKLEKSFEIKRGTTTLQQEVVGLRLPGYTNLVGLAAFLGQLNVAAGTRNPYLGIYGESGNVLWKVPTSAGEVTEVKKGLSPTSTEVTPRTR